MTLLRALRSRAGVAGSPPSGLGKTGFNVGGTSYYDGGYRYSNLLRDSTVSSGTVRSDGYPLAGNAATYLCLWENKYNWWAYKSGTYVVKGTGSGATITISGPGITTDAFATTNGVAFRRTVTVPALPAPTGDGAIDVVDTVIGLTVALNSAGVSDVTDFVVCHLDDEARIDAGGDASYFTAEAISDYTTASQGPLRTMNWQQMVQVWMQDAADIPPDLAIGNQGYAANNDGSKGAKNVKGIPSPEMMGRLATATGMELWVNAHPQMTDACLAAWFTRIGNEYPSGTIHVEVGNEPWNFAYFKINSGYLGSRYALSGQPGFGAAGIGTSGSSDDIQKALAHASLRAWKQAELVFGARVRRVVNVQLVNPGLSMVALDYVDSAGIIAAGQKVGQIMHSASASTYPLICPDVTANGLNTGRGVTQIPAYNLTVSRRKMIRDKAYENGSVNGGNAALWAEKAWRNAVDMIAAYIGTWQTQLSAKGYPAMTDEYEGHWIHDDFPLYTQGAFETANPTVPAAQCGIAMAYDSTTGALTPVTATINGDLYPDGGEALATWFTDADIIEATWSAGVTQNRTFACKIISGALYAFPTAAAYAAGLGSQFTGGTTGNCLISNITRLDAMSAFLLSLAWTNPNAIDGTTIIDYMRNSYYTAGLRNFATFIPVGNAFSAFNGSGFVSGSQPWAMKPDGHWQANTAAFNRLRALT